MEEKRLKSLFLTAWYPSKVDRMAGLFVQKHAEAVGRTCCDVTVLFAYPDKDSKKFNIAHNRVRNITEVMVTFPDPFKSPFYKIIKTINFLRAYKKGYQYLIKNNFNPDIIHVNILTRMGLIAYLLKTLRKKPYVITEHWSRYFPENISVSYSGIFRRLLTEFVVKHAEAIMPVSVYLKNAMLKEGLKNDNYIVVNNVVDDFFFKSDEKEAKDKKRILHVSGLFDETKNMSGILRAVKKVSEQRNDFEFIIIGDGIDAEKVKKYAHELELDSVVSFLGEKQPHEVSHIMKQCDFFVLFSNYENMPVVISESLVCGIPVIVPKTGGLPEMVNESNGKLVPVGNEKVLSETINWMLDHYTDYDPEKIKQTAANRYSFQCVGEIISGIYKKALKNKNKAT